MTTMDHVNATALTLKDTMADCVDAFAALSGRAKLAIVPIFLYFSIIPSLIGLAILRAIRAVPQTRTALLFLPAALFCLAHTWIHILAFLDGTFSAHADLEDFLLNSDLFDAAYVAVVSDPKRWFWSVQVLNFTVGLMVFYWSEGVHRCVFGQAQGAGRALARNAVSAFVYVWVGFLGAISVSLALFLAQRYATESKYMLTVMESHDCILSDDEEQLRVEAARSNKP